VRRARAPRGDGIPGGGPGPSRDHTSLGFTDERIELFTCTAIPGGEPEEEGIAEVVVLSLEEALQAVRDGEITDAKSVAALLLAADAT